MKKNMFVALLAVSTLLISANVQGQVPSAPIARGRMITAPNAGMDHLKLTDDQKAKIQALRKDFAVKDSVSMSKMRDERKASMEKQNAAFESILTTEQKEQLKKMREEAPNAQANRPAGFGQGMGQAAGRGRAQAMGQAPQGRPTMQGPTAQQGRQSMQGPAAMQGRQGMQGRQPMQGRQGIQGPGVQQGRRMMQGQGAMQGRQMMQGRTGAMQGKGFAQAGGMQGRQNITAAKGQKKGQFAKAKAPKRGLFAKHRMAKQRKHLAQARFNAPLVNPEIRINSQVETLTKQLDLTADQAQKIKDIRLKQSKKEINRFKKAQKKVDARAKKRNAPMEEIKSVLNEEQLKKLEALKVQRPAAQRGFGPMGQE